MRTTVIFRHIIKSLPIINPSNPSHATALLMKGFSKAAPSFGPNLLRREMSENRSTKMDEKPRDTAMNPGEEDGGAVRSSGTLEDRSERSAQVQK